MPITSTNEATAVATPIDTIEETGKTNLKVRKRSVSDVRSTKGNSKDKYSRTKLQKVFNDNLGDCIALVPGSSEYGEVQSNGQCYRLPAKASSITSAINTLRGSGLLTAPDGYEFEVSTDKAENICWAGLALIQS